MTEHLRLPSDPRIERAVVLQLLRDDHGEQWSRIELEAEASDVEPSALSRAVERLERHGVVVALDDWVLASRCARHLDELGLIGI
jgi:predicted transcriptional regulator